MNTPAAAAMGYQCDALETITRPHEAVTEEYTYQLRCQGEAVAKIIIIRNNRPETVKRCPIHANLLHAQAHLGKVQIVSEVKL